VIGGVVLSATLLSTLTLSAHRLEGPALTEPAAVEFSSLPSDDAPPVPEVVPPAGHPAETEDNAVLDRADVFPPFDITGQVSDEGGTPVAAAQVTLLDLTHDQVVAETTTDRAGHYTFAKPKLRVGIAPLASPHFEELDIAVVASAAGHGLAWESVRRLLLRRRGDVRYQISSEGALDSFVFAGRAVDAEDEPLRLEVNPRLTAARVLSGRVVDARGRAVPSARVTLASLVGSEPLPVPAEDSTVTGNLRVAHSALGTRIVAATTTDENGRWSLAGLPDDAQVSVAVSLPQGGRDDLIGRAENATGEVTAALDGSPTEANEIILPAMRHVDVLLRNSLTQQPLSGVDLSISQSLELGHQVRVTAVTDERGSASLWLPVGDCRARFFYRETDDKFAALTEVEQTFPVALGADAQQIELDVTPRPLVRIRVIDDATGLPVPNVQIDARRILAQGARASNELLPSGFSDRRGRITSLMPPGRWQFFVADQQLALEHGYRVLDPATEPVDLVSGNTYRYEFRVAKTSGSTLPQIQDDIKFASFLHQTAVASLRRHGVMVTTRLGAAPEKDPSGVVAYAVVTPHWSGVPQELDGLWQLDELAALIFGGPMMNPAGNVRTEVVVRDEMLQSMRGRKLETLVVEKADVTGDGLAALTTVQGLKQLTLGAETLDAQALSQIGRIRSLEMLNLNAPHIDTNDLRPLADLDRLTTLVVRTNASIRDTTSDIGKGSLVDATAHADDAFLQRAAKRPQLKTLKVTGAESSDAGIAHLAQYSWNTLMLGGPMPGVTDNSLETFERMSELKELTLFDMTFSEAGLKRFRETRPDVAIRVMNRNAAAANAAQ
ncbi:MAG: carboxypeptidase regulatory-like domain-containing protein, partial [Planctomycetales bacterium]|nr:carboxypeptidase regulatory-like domain-containing protein [Planctomycetales bacterium]